MKRILKWTACVVVFGAIFVVAVSAFMYLDTQSRVYSSVDEVPHAQVAVVLGASVTSKGALSPVLKERADKGIELYMAHKVSKILVSGDNSSLNHNEVRPVGNYLVEQGVPQQDIFLDYAGFDTYSSMYRAKAVFGVTSLIIVSQPFHLARAIFVARALGLEAYGIDASQGEAFLYNSIREVPASIKALIDIVIRREPKYLGETHNITEMSTSTWTD